MSRSKPPGTAAKDASEFILSVLENHQHRQIRSEIGSMLLETVDGPFTEWTDQTLEDIRRQGMALIEHRRGS
jgi:hypothetical protein